MDMSNERKNSFLNLHEFHCLKMNSLSLLRTRNKYAMALAFSMHLKVHTAASVRPKFWQTTNISAVVQQ